MYKIIETDCINCGICKEYCECEVGAWAIELHNPLTNFSFEINQDKCIQCGECAEQCPAGAIRQVDE